MADKPLLNDSRTPRLTTVQWLVCIIAAIGFAFDIYELLMLPLIVRPALQELGGFAPGSPEYKQWASILFYVPAVAGGIIGLIGGYLTDLLGRRRVLTGSILLYAFAAFAAGYSTNLYMLLFFRCLVFVGVCVEFVAAVAWLAELFDDARQRESVLGFTQAFSSVGGIMVALASSVALGWAVGKPGVLFGDIALPAVQLPAIQLPSWLGFLGTIKDGHAPWRYTLMSGLIPAIPLILIRPFLPESPKWAAKRDAGTLKRPSIAQLFSPQLRRTTLVTTLMFACSFGAAFGAIQQMRDIVPGLPETKAAARDKIAALAAKQNTTVDQLPDGLKKKTTGEVNQETNTHATKIQEMGGLVGRFLFAIIALFIVSRRRMLWVFLLPGLIVMPLVFGYAGTTSLRYLEYGIFFAGLLTVAQFSFWGNYLPHVYPLHLRGTGESFAANIGGRLIGTSFAAVTLWLSNYMPGAGDPMKVAYASAAVATGLYLTATIACFWLPEPKEHDSLAE